ncbi:MAG: hypothetical protein NC078_04090 [Ruminococcus sp.]|nr:hypothetical protein [Ruminococcus sp.]
MITKKDLEDYRYREIELEQQFAKLRMWKNRLTRLNTVYGSGRMAEKLGYLSDCLQLRGIVREIENGIDLLYQKYKEVDSLIGRISDPKIKAVMTQYYVLCAADWEEVAAIVGVSVRTVHRLHGYGLEMLRHMQERECVLSE